MGRILRSGGLLYFIILMVFAVILIRVLSAGNPDVKELNNLEFRKAVEDKAFVTNLPENDPDRLTIKDEDQKVTGLYRPPGGVPVHEPDRRRRAAQQRGHPVQGRSA